jgi:hypothetical protein
MIGGTSPDDVMEGSGSPSTPGGLLCARREHANVHGDTYEPPQFPSPTNELPALLSVASTPHMSSLSDRHALGGLHEFDPPTGQSSATKKARRGEPGQLSSSASRQISGGEHGTRNASGTKAAAGESSSSSLQSYPGKQPIRGSGLQGRNLRPHVLPPPNVAAARSRPTGPSADALMERIRSMQETQMTSGGACQSSGMTSDTGRARDSLHGRLVQAVDEASVRDEVRCNPGFVCFWFLTRKLLLQLSVRAAVRFRH